MHVIISDDEFLYFTDRALDKMARILRDLGDDLANTTPELPGANSPFAIVTHCLGVAEYWAGHVVAGRAVERDRDAEFTASGQVSDLLTRVEATKRQLREDLGAADFAAPPRNEPHQSTWRPPVLSQAGALVHVYEELAQHLGQLDITSDLLHKNR